MIIDLPSDNGLVHLGQISRIVELPGFVKEADVKEERETADLPRESFADPIVRKFPIHTKASAFLSYAYFLKQAADLQGLGRVRAELGFKKAASIWNLKGEFKHLREQFAPKETHTKIACAISKNGAEFFPIDTPKNIYASATSLVENRERFPFELRKEASTKIMNAASIAGLPLSTIPSAVHRMAGYGLTTKAAAQGEVSRRLSYLRSNAHNEVLTESMKKLSEVVNSIAIDVVAGEDLTKIAVALDLFDRATGITGRYGDDIPFPEDVLCAFTKHAADELSSNLVVLVNGSTYHLYDLEKAADAFHTLGNDTLSAITDITGALDLHKVADIVPTLPRDDADILDIALNAAGIGKVSMDKTAMVHNAVKDTMYTGIHVVPAPTPEPTDPLLKRASSVLKLLKEGEEDTGEATGVVKSPRSYSGKYVNKAPNESTLNIIDTQTEPEKSMA
jgi:hypothetical protein